MKKLLYYTPLYSKSREHIVEILAKTISDGRKAVYILPSREAMFDVRRKIMDRCGAIANAHIFGFDDLERILCAGHINPENIIHDNISMLIISSILEKLGKEGKLGYFDRVSLKSGFSRTVLDAIKRLKRLCISPDELLARTRGNPMLKKKAEDISKIYGEYEDFKKQRTLYDINDLSYIAAGIAKDSEFFKDIGLFAIDGFINIDPVNMLLVKNVTAAFENIDFYANIPFKTGSNDEFISIEVLKDLKGAGFELQNASFQMEPANENIVKAAQNLFSNNVCLKDQASGITVMNAPCIEDEIRQAGRIIKRKLVEGETEPEKIAVYIKNLDKYAPAIKTVFGEYGIPVRLEECEKLSQVPVISDVLSLARLFAPGEESEAMRNILGSKYLLPTDFLKGISYENERLKRILNRIRLSSSKNNMPELLKQILETEGLEKEIKNIQMLKDFAGRISSLSVNSAANVQDFFKCLKLTVDDLDIKGNILSLAKEGVLQSKLAIRDLKALETFERVLDEYAEAMQKYGTGSFSNTLEGKYKLLLEILSATVLPATKRDLEGVRIIDPDLARGQLYDTVFIMGVNEGVFPLVPASSSVFDRFENNELMKLGINLFNPSWEMDREKIRFSLCVASARKDIYFSFRTCDEDGGYMLKSSFIEDLLALMEDKVKKTVANNTVFMRDRFKFHRHEPFSASEAARALADHIWNRKGDVDESIKTLGGIAKAFNDEGLRYINHAASMELSREENPHFDCYDGLLSAPKLAQADASYAYSASQLNSYAKCPFMYYAQRVLGIKDLEEDEITAFMETGTFYHEILKDYYTDNEKFDTFDENRLAKIFNKSFEAFGADRFPEAVSKYIKNEMWLVISGFLQADAQNLQYYEQSTGRKIKPVILR
ncbi:MAG: PD-(D/E)XK nuclease family protein [Clostridia bacterium]|nr:PD-(D/E)XK nuclease family protein [Clostridia bacterium]